MECNVRPASRQKFLDVICDALRRPSWLYPRNRTHSKLPGATLGRVWPHSLSVGAVAGKCPSAFAVAFPLPRSGRLRCKLLLLAHSGVRVAYLPPGFRWPPTETCEEIFSSAVVEPIRELLSKVLCSKRSFTGLECH